MTKFKFIFEEIQEEVSVNDIFRCLNDFENIQKSQKNVQDVRNEA